jgi:5-methyltetrahydropteroyltriglutamate--homocysteine methyltransferase
MNKDISKMTHHGAVPIQTTMTGSWYRTPEILELIRPDRCPTGEISPEHADAVEAAERRAIRDQLHPLGSEKGLDWVSNGEQRKAGYTYYLPNRFTGFSTTEKSQMEVQPTMIEELTESNPALVGALKGGGFSLAKVVDRLQYVGGDLARKEAVDARRLASLEGGTNVFIPAPSPGVITVFYPQSSAYSDHTDYLFSLGKELRKEYEAILSVPGIVLQLDSPDLAMGKQTASWGGDHFFSRLAEHVDAINEAISGLPSERIRVHYCYGNWNGSHRFDADFSKVLPELLRLKAGCLVGELANPRHEGDSLVIEGYLKEHDWPKGLKLAAGVIDVKTPIVESPETVALRLERLARLDKIGPGNLLGGTDCGFETFAYVDNVTYAVGLQKLKSLAEGARLESDRLGLS